MEFLNVKIDVTIIRQASARVDPAGEHERFFFVFYSAQPSRVMDRHMLALSIGSCWQT